MPIPIDWPMMKCNPPWKNIHLLPSSSSVRFSSSSWSWTLSICFCWESSGSSWDLLQLLDHLETQQIPFIQSQPSIMIHWPISFYTWQIERGHDIRGGKETQLDWKLLSNWSKDERNIFVSAMNRNKVTPSGKWRYMLDNFPTLVDIKYLWADINQLQEGRHLAANNSRVERPWEFFSKNS